VGVGDLAVFPCLSSPDPLRNKRPATTRGFYDALHVEPPEAWQLVGVRAGAESGVDCLDIDPAKGGDRWYDANFDAIPWTRAHATQRDGVHLLFRHAPGLKSSVSRIALGVDVRADGAYFIWWPREGLPFEDHPICDWPDWLLAEAMGKRRKLPSAAGTCLRAPFQPGTEGEFDLFRIDPTKYQDLNSWLALMTACKVAGVDREAFVVWSISDPKYADHALSVREIWDRLKPDGRISEATLFQALRRVEGVPEDTASQKPQPGRRQLTWRDKARMKGIADVVVDEGKLFWAACRYGELRMEIRIEDDVLEELLMAAAWRAGLKNKVRARRQIRNGLRVGSQGCTCHRAPSNSEVSIQPEQVTK
jgi:hypothetical protein